MLDQRASGVGLDLEPQVAATRDHPLRELPRFHALLGADVATGLADGLVKASGSLRARVLAGEERHRSLAWDRVERRLERLEILVLPPLRAVGDDEPPAERERHRVEARRDRLWRRALALEQLDPLGTALGLGQGAQPRPALGDPAVVVAVDQIRGLERGHLGRV